MAAGGAERKGKREAEQGWAQVEQKLLERQGGAEGRERQGQQGEEEGSKARAKRRKGNAEAEAGKEEGGTGNAYKR